MRSPVAALAAVAEAISEPTREPAMRRELVRLALAACQSIERLIVDVAVSSVRFESVDVATLARDTATSSNVAGVTVLAEVLTEPAVVDGDPVRLRQALDNLVANALRHAAPSSPVAIRVRRTSESVEIAVVDAGVGIPADQLARIFKLGTRLDSATPGSGIGLTLTRAIVEAHGGTLQVDSAEGVGSTFTIVLPAPLIQSAT